MAVYPPPAPCRLYVETLGGNCLKLFSSGMGAPNAPYIISGELDLGGTLRCTPNGLEVRLSTDNNNMLSLGSDGGIFAHLPHFQDDSALCIKPNGCIDVTVGGQGTECDPFVVSGKLLTHPLCDLVHCTNDGLCVDPTRLKVENTSCMQLILTGEGSNAKPYLLKVNPIINPSGSGLLSCGPNGLNVAPTFILAQDTNTANHTLLGEGTANNPYILSTTVAIDPRLSNLLHQSASGLYVECAEIANCVELRVVDTNTINHTLIGTGTESNPWVLSSVVKVDPSATNILSVTANGLMVACADVLACLNPVTVTVTDTSTVNMTSTPTGNDFNLQSVVKVSATAGNALTVNADGLYVPTVDPGGCDVHVGGDVSNDTGTFGPLGAGTHTLGTTGPVSITIPSTRECAMKVFRNWGIAVDVPVGANVRALAWVDFSVNGGAYTPYVFHASNLAPYSRTEAINANNTEIQTQYLNPGATVTVDMRLRLELLGGSMSAPGSWIAGMVLIPTGG